MIHRGLEGFMKLPKKKKNRKFKLAQCKELQTPAVSKSPQALMMSSISSIKKTYKTFGFAPTFFSKWKFGFNLLTRNWTLLKESVRTDFMVVSWELILHLGLIFAENT